MSTGLEVQRLVSENRLVQLEPRSRASRYRLVVVEPNLANAFNGPWPAGSDDERLMPQFKQQIDNFILGGIIAATFRAEPKVELRRLGAIRGIRSKAIWEFRFTPRKRQDHLRLFGCFAEKDLFVGLGLHVRAGINWNVEIFNANVAWKGIFPTSSYIETESIHDYVSPPVSFF